MQSITNENRIILTHGGENPEDYRNAVTPPIFMNSLHAFDRIEDWEASTENGFYYGRHGNINVHILEEKLAALERGSQAVAFASGIAAFTAAVTVTCKAGSHVICMRNAYCDAKESLEDIFGPNDGMSLTYVSGSDPEELEAAIREETALIVLESPASYLFSVADIRMVAEVARRHGVKTYLDNTCSSPIFQNPLDMGIDIVMHSLSKFIGGHSDIIGGALIGRDEELMAAVKHIRSLHGAILCPMEAWLAVRGLRTLDLRMQESQRTGMAVAEYLEQHPKVERVFYTGLASHPQAELIARQQRGHSSLMSFILKSEDIEESRAFLNRLKLFGKGCSWGGFESLALLPFFDATPRTLEITGGDLRLIRIYCGLEGRENLIADLEQALAGVK